jgi:hypothetical protein
MMSTNEVDAFMYDRRSRKLIAQSSEGASDAVKTIMKCVISEYYFGRRQSYSDECKGDDESESYEEFLAWNRKCLDSMDKEEIDWLLGFCTRLNNGMVQTMDMECPSASTADTIYFDKNKNLVIANPR